MTKIDNLLLGILLGAVAAVFMMHNNPYVSGGSYEVSESGEILGQIKYIGQQLEKHSRDEYMDFTEEEFINWVADQEMRMSLFYVFRKRYAVATPPNEYSLSTLITPWQQLVEANIGLTDADTKFYTQLNKKDQHHED